MISPQLHSALLVGSITVVVAAALVAIVLRPTGDPSKSRGPMFGALAVMAGCGAVAYWTYGYSLDVIVVRDDMTFKRGFMRAIDADLPRTDATNDRTRSEPVWIVNRSSVEVRVVTVEYANSQTNGRGYDGTRQTITRPHDEGPTPIPPNSAARVPSVDYIGPKDPPPAAITSEVAVAGESRKWLTWGD